MSLFSYVQNVRAEMKHVVWPTNKQTIVHVGVIVLVSLIAGLMVAGFDGGFTLVARQIVGA